MTAIKRRALGATKGPHGLVSMLVSDYLGLDTVIFSFEDHHSTATSFIRKFGNMERSTNIGTKSGLVKCNYRSAAQAPADCMADNFSKAPHNVKWPAGRARQGRAGHGRQTDTQKADLSLSVKPDNSYPHVNGTSCGDRPLSLWRGQPRPTKQ